MNANRTIPVHGYQSRLLARNEKQPNNPLLVDLNAQLPPDHFLFGFGGSHPASITLTIARHPRVPAGLAPLLRLPANPVSELLGPGCSFFSLAQLARNPANVGLDVLLR